jgi:hypothetical protein
MNISDENRLLLCCARTRISEQQRDYINDLVGRDIDWKKLSDSAYEIGLYPILYIHLRDIPNRHSIPKELMKMIKKAYHDTTAINMFFYHELQRIIDACHAREIEVILLKGAVLAKIVYEDIGLRSMSDLDILIKREDVVHMKEIMSNLDYVSVMDKQEDHRHEKHFHLPQYKHREKNIVVEIHLNITEKSICISTEEWWHRAQSSVFFGSKAIIPSPEDMVIHLCLHLYNHGYRHNMLLRGLCDINETLRHYKNEIDTNLLQGMVNDLKIDKHVYSILYLIKTCYRENNDSLEWLKQYHFDLSFIAILRQRLFIGKEQHTSILSGLIKFFKLYSFSERMTFIRQLLFPSLHEMSRRYSVHTSSKKIYLYYLFRPFILLKKYRKNVAAIYRIEDKEEDLQ